MARPPLSKRRLFGLDRSGPNPDATSSGQPLRPLTIPNAIGYVRLAMIPVFLIVALSSGNGRSALAATLFAVIAWADYLDGFTARLTGQFSRLGALLDPVIDRLLVVSGMVVAWDFRLLPRWAIAWTMTIPSRWCSAIALAIIRELLMLVLSRYSMSRGLEIKINWVGRLGVAPMMAAPFFAMAGVHWLALAMLYLGLVLAWLASCLYVRGGLRDIRQASS